MKKYLENCINIRIFVLRIYIYTLLRWRKHFKGNNFNKNRYDKRGTLSISEQGG